MTVSFVGEQAIATEPHAVLLLQLRSIFLLIVVCFLLFSGLAMMIESDLCVQSNLKPVHYLSTSFHSVSHLAFVLSFAATPRRPAASTSPTSSSRFDTGEHRFAFKFSILQSRLHFCLSRFPRSVLARSVQETCNYDVLFSYLTSHNCTNASNEPFTL